MAIIELVDRDEKAKGLDSGPVQKKKTQTEDKIEDASEDKKQEIKSQEGEAKVDSKELKENEEIAKKLEEKKKK